MPTYEYICDDCKNEFETMQSMKEEPLEVCPKCNKNTLRRLITGGVGVIFKGSGWTPKGNSDLPLPRKIEP